MGVGVKQMSELELLQLILNELIQLRRDLRDHYDTLVGLLIEEARNR